MKTHTTKTPAVPTTLAANTVPKHASIKLGIDAHADNYRVVRMIEGCIPQPAQKFTSIEALLAFVEKQLRLAAEVHTCYEAGPLGYTLHRRLLAAGAHNVVVVPVNLDEHGKGVKTDARDALALCTRLGRYAAGDKSVFSVVTVPTPEQERARAVGRERQALVKERKRAAIHISSTALYFGIRLPAGWWKSKPRRASTLAGLDEFLRGLAARWVTLIAMLDEQIADLEKRIEAEAPAELPHHMGALTASMLDREVRDWNRFGNRRAIASFTGLCPGVDSSGSRHFQGSVTKHGNVLLRSILIELAWRLLRSQPEYSAVKKWRSRLVGATGAMRKKIAVAVARQFAVDWWRVKTGRRTAESLGLVVAGL